MALCSKAMRRRTSTTITSTDARLRSRPRFSMPISTTSTTARRRAAERTCGDPGDAKRVSAEPIIPQDRRANRSAQYQLQIRGMISVMREAKKVPILMYHSISDHASSAFKSFAVAPSLFSEQMAYLSSHNYTVLTVTQLVQGYLHNRRVL